MRAARLTRQQVPANDTPSLPLAAENVDLSKLLEENAQLRELVIQLTKIAIKNIVDPPPRVS
jgi:hypothetical protein